MLHIKNKQNATVSLKTKTKKMLKK